MKNNLDYYRHKADSHRHWKFKTLRRKFGWAAEGKFWALNNLIAESENCLLDLTDINKHSEISSELDFEPDQLDEFMEFLIKTCRLLVDVDGKFTTEMVQETLGTVGAKRLRQREWKVEKSTKKTDESTSTNLKSTSKDDKSISENQQSKAKESKVNKSKVQRGSDKPTRPGVIFIEPRVDDVRNYFLSTIGDSTRTGSWPADKCKSQADLFYNHFKATGWKRGSGLKIIDWKAAARKWIEKERGWMAEKQASTKTFSSNMPVPKIETAVPKIDKVACEINFLFGRFREDPESFTVITADVTHYNYLKNSGRVEFSPDKVKQIRQMAEQHLVEKELPTSDHYVIPLMKKIGVIEFFKSLKETGAEAVFHAQN